MCLQRNVKTLRRLFHDKEPEAMTFFSLWDFSGFVFILSGFILSAVFKKAA